MGSTMFENPHLGIGYTITLTANSFHSWFPYLIPHSSQFFSKYHSLSHCLFHFLIHISFHKRVDWFSLNLSDAPHNLNSLNFSLNFGLSRLQSQWLIILSHVLLINSTLHFVSLNHSQIQTLTILIRSFCLTISNFIKCDCNNTILWHCIHTIQTSN